MDVRFSSAISHVVYSDPEASVSGDLLCPNALRYTTAAGNILSTTTPSSGISAPSSDVLLPAPSSSIQRRVTSAGLLLPTTSSQSAVDFCGYHTRPGHLIRVKDCARFLWAVFRPISSFPVRNGKAVSSDVDGLSYLERITPSESFSPFERSALLPFATRTCT